MYNKLFTKILDSSVWLEPIPTRIVWVTLLAAMDEKGFCAFAAAGNVANRARVTVDEAREALQTLESPDPDSSDPEHDGKRIERVPGGWMVLNADKYRLISTRQQAQEKTNERVRKHRDKKRIGNASETLCNASETPSDTDTYTDTKKHTSASGKPSERVLSIYKAYPRHVAPKRAYAAISKALQECPANTLLASVEAYARKVKADGTEERFIPHPATWFNQGRWGDGAEHPSSDLPPKPAQDEKPVHEYRSNKIDLDELRRKAVIQ